MNLVKNLTLTKKELDILTEIFLTESGTWITIKMPGAKAEKMNHLHKLSSGSLKRGVQEG